MIVPEFWAEGRVQHREKGKQVTVRRFGWSDQSLEDAQAMADVRARQALENILNVDAKARRIEPKVPYNGAEGVPIREEIVSRHGDCVITRNSYGARCLNTPNVLFVDIDLPQGASCWLMSVVTIVLLIAGIAWAGDREKWMLLGVILAALFGGHYVAGLLYKAVLAVGGGAEGIALGRVKKFVLERRDWNARIYRTPSGLRVMGLHRTFDPEDPEVLDCFAKMGSDKLYVRMCRNQRCFRARLSPKPWRLGIDRHIISGRVAWPPKPDRLPARRKWIEEYEGTASGHAACAWIEDIGSGIVSPEVGPVMELHDRESRALSGLPTA